jgi:hypothetical protein
MFINYTITGVDYQAGPFSPEEVEAHQRDIAGYAGVTQCFVVLHRDQRRNLISNDREKVT